MCPNITFYFRCYLALISVWKQQNVTRSTDQDIRQLYYLLLSSHLLLLSHLCDNAI